MQNETVRNITNGSLPRFHVEHDSAALGIEPMRFEDYGIEILCHLQNSIGTATQSFFLHRQENLKLCVLARDNSTLEVRDRVGGNRRGRRKRRGRSKEGGGEGKGGEGREQGRRRRGGEKREEEEEEKEEEEEEGGEEEEEEEEGVAEHGIYIIPTSLVVVVVL